MNSIDSTPISVVDTPLIGNGGVSLVVWSYSDKRNLTMETPKRLNKRQRAALLDLISDVNSEDCHTIADAIERLDNPKLTFLLDWPIYSAGENVPGYLPDSPYTLFHTERAARGYCRELESESGHTDGGYVCDIIPTTLRDQLDDSPQPQIRCDSCDAAMINEVFCHETGCPNSGKTWIADREQFVRFVQCHNCGYEVELGERCDCQDE
jgi:hypothetical protein